MSGLAEASSEPDALMAVLYYMAGFILAMTAPIAVTLLYGSATPQLMTFSFILYAILAGILEGMVNTPVIAASIDVALVLIAVSNYASLHAVSSEANIRLLPFAVVEASAGHSVVAPDFSQLSVLALLIIHRDRLRQALHSAWRGLRAEVKRYKAHLNQDKQGVPR